MFLDLKGNTRLPDNLVWCPPNSPLIPIPNKKFRDCHKILFAGVIVIAGAEREGWAITLTEFEALFQSYHTLVYRRLYYLLGERAVAEDLTQEAFLKLYHSPPREIKPL
jgi:hypothetical protein